VVSFNPVLPTFTTAIACGARLPDEAAQYSHRAIAAASQHTPMTQAAR
jgi:hypothetical protein